MSVRDFPGANPENESHGGSGHTSKSRSPRDQHLGNRFGDASVLPDIEEVERQEADRQKSEAARKLKEEESQRQFRQTQIEEILVEQAAAKMQKSLRKFMDRAEIEAVKFEALCTEVFFYRKERGLARLPKDVNLPLFAAVVLIVMTVEVVLTQKYMLGTGFLPSADAALFFALSVTGINCVFALFGGLVCWRRVRHLRATEQSEVTEKRWAKVGAIGITVCLLVLHLSVGVVRSSDSGSAAEILLELERNPALILPFYNLHSLIGFMLGVASSVLFWVKGYGLLDPVPGYSQVAGRVTSSMKKIERAAWWEQVWLKCKLGMVSMGKSAENVALLEAKYMAVDETIDETVKHFHRIQVETEERIRQEISS